MNVQPDTRKGQERSAATRRRIVGVARELVAERGYAGLSTSEAKVRIGHFAEAAVLEALELDVVAQLAEVVAGAPDQLAALETGIQWYLDECLRSTELQRVGLMEGRKALGWEAWREIIAPHGLGMLSAALALAMEEGLIQRADADALAHLLLAALHEASALILSAPDRLAERERTGATMAMLLNGLRMRDARG